MSRTEDAELRRQRQDQVVLDDLADKVSVALGSGPRKPEGKRSGTLVVTPGVLIPAAQVKRLLELLGKGSE